VTRRQVLMNSRCLFVCFISGTMRFLDTARCKIWVDRNLFVKVTGNLASFHWKGFKFNLHLLTKRMENGKWKIPTHPQTRVPDVPRRHWTQSVSQSVYTSIRTHCCGWENPQGPLIAVERDNTCGGPLGGGQAPIARPASPVINCEINRSALS
jgi:hypothetical protein